ncbi:MAG: exosortase F system-associated protein [Flavobacteriaceae bacterium]|nr:exosortase F system-associated protein [Flavobacteriaceae bacterium]
MLNVILRNKIRVFSVGILFFLLVLVRGYESFLFYDPFLLYFKGDFNSMVYPTFDSFPFITNLLFRYGLNTCLSIGIIFALFQDKQMIKFIAFLYFIFFIILFVLFFIVLHYSAFFSYLSLFYVRRFLIQPIFLLLFILGLYYQKVSHKL